LGLKQGINKRGYRAATKNNQEAKQDKDDDDWDEPEFLVVHEEAPGFFDQPLGLVVGDVVNGFGFFFLHAFIVVRSKHLGARKKQTKKLVLAKVAFQIGGLLGLLPVGSCFLVELSEGFASNDPHDNTDRKDRE
jgi:hypothetical protein